MIKIKHDTTMMFTHRKKRLNCTMLILIIGNSPDLVETFCKTI